ncbi:hypothetical protein FK220_009960 [Flavobacteriaceae bacterium TP-CH-4]|uniref:DUF4386 domain-containing protein n=1 Tax=Pelagihabitans pacificus TaxID=2696054 RepID=A0A967B032_9FLAO|nr:hypothetical protein [Pelagihabitans pacificus]NHF59666.1 hypothetical protein [Pelagihabitans pacificus]
MKKDFETKFTGWAFIAAALMLWGGWLLSPHHVGEYLVASDFVAINEQLWTWIWMYRIHIFGWVIMAIAMFALASITFKKPYRVLITPGAGMVVVGSITLAIASAFYYNFGAWGVGNTIGKSAAEVQEFMNNILYTNQYVTCFVRFGRVFSGVGLVLLGLGLVKWKIVSVWLGWFTALLGLAAMAIVMGIPDNFEIYKPLFHMKAIWLAVMGVSIVRLGVHLPDSKS